MTTSGKPERVKLRPADSFELIRLIARSQSDPRKAVAELVQNSMDAGATTIRLAWSSTKSRRTLSVWDDGRGIFPDVERPDALRSLVTSIGHSHKAQLTPVERHRQMTLGKYGIGLLGFWSAAQAMEIRTRVAGSDTWMLRLEEDVREGVISRPRASRLPILETFTEVVLGPLHDHAAAQLKPRRIAAYLAGELRGQLLQREVRLEIHDHVARGRAQKLLLVRPQRYLGMPLPEITDLDIPGFDAARVELYLIPSTEDRRGRVTLACGGSTVLDDMASIDGADESREPWNSGRFEGVIDVPDLEVAPSTRRGFVPNAAAHALLAALPTLEARLRELLSKDEEQRREAEDAQDARDLRRLFRRLTKMLPHYSLLDVKDGRDPGPEPARGPEGAEFGEVPLAPGVSEEQDTDLAEAPELAPSLFPPGPLASLDLRPRRSIIALESSRKLRARPLDATGREIDRDIALEWSLRGSGALEPQGRGAIFQAPDEPCEAVIIVTATEGADPVEATARIRVSESIDPEPGASGGIPEPEPVSEPTEDWRSRIDGGRWLYNVAHPDYREVQGEARRRLRYLSHLFAKELVLRNFGEPSQGELLERMVQVLTYVDNPAREPAREKPGSSAKPDPSTK